MTGPAEARRQRPRRFAASRRQRPHLDPGQSRDRSGALSHGRLSGVRRARGARRYSGTARRSDPARRCRGAKASPDRSRRARSPAAASPSSTRMTSLTGASGEDFASILRSLGYRMERRPKPPEPRHLRHAAGRQRAASPVARCGGRLRLADAAAAAPSAGDSRRLDRDRRRSIEAPKRQSTTAAATAVEESMRRCRQSITPPTARACDRGIADRARLSKLPLRRPTPMPVCKRCRQAVHDRPPNRS